MIIGPYRRTWQVDETDYVICTAREPCAPGNENGAKITSMQDATGPVATGAQSGGGGGVIARAMTYGIN